MKENQKDARTHIDVLFLGGVGNNVTGSSTLLCIDKKHYGLIDAGGFQAEGEEIRNSNFPVNAAMIEFVIITHAHFDHIGLLPKLVKEGFKGKVFITERAMSQGRHILYDSAKLYCSGSGEVFYRKKIVEKEKKDFEKKLTSSISCKDRKKLESAVSQLDDCNDLALYNKEDVDNLSSFYEILRPGILTEVIPDVFSIKLLRNAHQNGAISVELYVKSDSSDEKVGVLFTGDIGPKESLLYVPTDHSVKNEEINHVVIESLHGVDYAKETLNECTIKLRKTIRNGLREGKTIFLIGFSLDRNAQLVYLINQMLDSGMHFNVYFDAPLAYALLMLYQNFYKREHFDHRSDDDKWFKDLGDEPFDLSRFKVIKKFDEHIELLNDDSPKVVITSSAMGTGGRVVDFFDRFIQSINALFIVCGWVYPGSPSDVLLKTERKGLVDFGEKRFKKNCESMQIQGFSSHGYFDEFLDFLSAYPSKKCVLLNHANDESKKSIFDEISNGKYGNFSVKVPDIYSGYTFYSDEAIELDDCEIFSIFKDVIIPTNMQCILDDIENSKIS